MIRFKQSGNFRNSEKYLSGLRNKNYRAILERFAIKGVDALIASTPVDSGITAGSWTYEIEMARSGFKINWLNDHIVDGIPVAILVQYGHGTTGGTFVEGRDFINPAMRPIFEQLAEELWKEVTLQ